MYSYRSWLTNSLAWELDGEMLVRLKTLKFLNPTRTNEAFLLQNFLRAINLTSTWSRRFLLGACNIWSSRNFRTIAGGAARSWISSTKYRRSGVLCWNHRKTSLGMNTKVLGAFWQQICDFLSCYQPQRSKVYTLTERKRHIAAQTFSRSCFMIVCWPVRPRGTSLRFNVIAITVMSPPAEFLSECIKGKEEYGTGGGVVKGEE